MRPLDNLIIYLYHSLTILLNMLVFVYVAVAVFVSMSVLKIVAILLCMAVIFVVSPVLMSDSALDEQSFNANESDNR